MGSSTKGKATSVSEEQTDQETTTDPELENTREFEYEDNSVDIIDYNYSSCASFMVKRFETRNGPIEQVEKNIVINKELIDDDENGDSFVRCLSLVILAFSSFLGGSSLSILAPFYCKEAELHGISITGSGTVFASIFVLQIIFTPVFGKYLQIIGSIRLFILGVLLSGLTNIIFGFLPVIESGPVFLTASLVTRSVTAIGEAAINTSVFPLARRRSQKDWQSTMMSILESMVGLGTTIGPFIGGILFDYGGFYLPFTVCGSLLVASACVAHCVLDPKEEQAGVSKEEDAGVTTYRILLCNPVMIVTCIVTICTGISTGWYQPTLEPYVREQFSLTPTQASLLFVIDGGVYAIVTPIVGRFLDKGLDCKCILLVGSAIILIGYLLLAPAPPFLLSPSLLQMCLGAGVHGAGMAFNLIGTLTLLGRGHPDTEQVQGMVTGIWITCESLGGVIGSVGGGASFDKFDWVTSCLLAASSQMVSIVMLVIGCMVPIIAKKMESQSEEEKLLKNDWNNNYGACQNCLLHV